MYARAYVRPHIYKEGAGGGNQTCSGSCPIFPTGKDLKQMTLPVVPYLSSEGNKLIQSNCQPGSEQACMQYGKAEVEDPLMKQCGHIPRDSYSEPGIQNRSEVIDLRQLLPFFSLHWQDGERWVWEKVHLKLLLATSLKEKDIQKMLLNLAHITSGVLSSLTYCFYPTLFLDPGERSIWISNAILWKP